MAHYRLYDKNTNMHSSNRTNDKNSQNSINKLGGWVRSVAETAGWVNDCLLSCFGSSVLLVIAISQYGGGVVDCHNL